MKRFVNHLSLLAAGAMVATGCVPTRHNLPPAHQLMEPGPGVGGPGPGVLGPPPYAAAPAPAGPAVAAIAQSDESQDDSKTSVATGDSSGSEIRQVGFIGTGAACNTPGSNIPAG